MAFFDAACRPSEKSEARVQSGDKNTSPLVDMTSEDVRNFFHNSSDSNKEKSVAGELYFEDPFEHCRQFANNSSKQASEITNSQMVAANTNEISSLKETTAQLSSEVQSLEKEVEKLNKEIIQLSLESNQNGCVSDNQTSGQGCTSSDSSTSNTKTPTDQGPSPKPTSDGNPPTPAGESNDNPATPSGTTNDSPPAPTTTPTIDTPTSSGKSDVGTIHGVNLSGAEWNSDEHWPTLSELQQYKADGLNTIRLPISWQRFQNAPYAQLDPNQLNQLDSVLKDAQSLGLKVIIDNHNYNRYGAPEEINWGKGPVVTDHNMLADFWSQMSAHVNKSPYASAVSGYDIMNEPDNDGNNWWPNAQNAINAIRQNGDTKPIFVENDAYNGKDTLDNFKMLNDPRNNLVYEVHTYWDPGHSGNYAGNEPANSQVAVNAIRSFVEWLKANHKQGLVGEFQVPANDPQWIQAESNMLNYLNQNDVGWTAWGGGAFGKSGNAYYIPGSLQEQALRNAANS